MIEFLRLILHIIASFFKPRTKLVAEILILRQQLNVLRRQVSKRPQLSNTDRFLFVWLYRWFPCVLSAIAIHPLASLGVSRPNCAILSEPCKSRECLDHMIVF